MRAASSTPTYSLRKDMTDTVLLETLSVMTGLTDSVLNRTLLVKLPDAPRLLANYGTRRWQKHTQLSRKECVTPPRKTRTVAWVRSAPYVRSLVRLALSVGFLLESCSAGWKSLLVHLVPSDHSRMSADRSRRMAREVLRENCWVRRSQDVDDWRLGCAPTWLSADR